MMVLLLSCLFCQFYSSLSPAYPLSLTYLIRLASFSPLVRALFESACFRRSAFCRLLTSEIHSIAFFIARFMRGDRFLCTLLSACFRSHLYVFVTLLFLLISKLHLKFLFFYCATWLDLIISPVQRGVSFFWK